jgi:hypothetical protein
VDEIDSDYIVARTREAYDTLRRLPGGIGPAQLKAAWPEPVRNAIEAYGYTSDKPRLPPPRPSAIDRMDEVFTWFNFLTNREETRAYWLCAGAGLRFRKAANILGVSRETVRLRTYVAVERIRVGLLRRALDERFHRKAT